MHPNVEERLLDLNREFYQSFAADFAASRPTPRPGVEPFLKGVGRQQSVLDLGCGHGTLITALRAQGYRGRYLGLDVVFGLLVHARKTIAPSQGSFVQADLAAPGWERLLAARFDWLFALALLHHLPGYQRRLDWAAGLEPLLAEGGTVIVSVWNFMVEQRWRERIVPWGTLGLEGGQVEAGDYLLDWRRGGTGLRYVHQFGVEELAQLAHAAGLAVQETHYAGGKSGRLNLLQKWHREQP